MYSEKNNSMTKELNMKQIIFILSLVENVDFVEKYKLVDFQVLDNGLKSIDMKMYVDKKYIISAISKDDDVVYKYIINVKGNNVYVSKESSDKKTNDFTISFFSGLNRHTASVSDSLSTEGKNIFMYNFSSNVLEVTNPDLSLITKVSGKAKRIG